MSAGARSLSPRLASLLADSSELQDALVMNEVFTSQELAYVGIDAEDVATRLGLSQPARQTFPGIFAFVRDKAGKSMEAKMGRPLDVLSDSGEMIMRRTRADIHQKGFWHRVVNVWVICPETARVLIGQRAVSKDMDPEKWTCACGRVNAGDSSMDAAVEYLYAEFGITARPDVELSLGFNVKCPRDITRGLFNGQIDKAWIDVYVCRLDQEVPMEMVQLDVSTKRAARYIEVHELEKALIEQDPTFVIPTNEEYAKKLLHVMKRMCADEGKKQHFPCLEPGSTRPVAGN